MSKPDERAEELERVEEIEREEEAAGEDFEESETERVEETEREEETDRDDLEESERVEALLEKAEETERIERGEEKDRVDLEKSGKTIGQAEGKESDDQLAEQKELTTETGLRRSTRVCRLTERAAEHKKTTLADKFWREYRICEALIIDVGLEDTANLPQDEKRNICLKIRDHQRMINEIFVDIRGISADYSPPEIVRGADRMNADLETTFNKLLREHPKRRTSQDGRSVASSRHSRRSERSHRSNASISSQRVEAAARMAALQAELKAQREEKGKEEELLQLEMEEAKLRASEMTRKAEMEAEEVRCMAAEIARKAELEAKLKIKRKEIERQKVTTLFKIEEARLKALEDEDFDGERHSDDSVVLRGRTQSLAIEKVPDLSNPELRMETPAETHALKRDETVAAKTESILNPAASPWQPHRTDRDRQPSDQKHSSQEFREITDAFSASIALARLPTPEPPIFSGDALSYPDWKQSFYSLIESRGIPVQERIHFLRKYVKGGAEEVVSGYFLLGGEDAFEQAKQALEERFGDPFLISEAFRDKLEAWPKIGPRDSKGLRSLSDFLRQCHTAMNNIQGLEVLNDCRENRRILMKLPDWLVTKWARTVARTKTEYLRYPSFSEFTRFMTEEAKIACDPITSLGALRSQDKDRSKEFNFKRKEQKGVRTLATGSRPEVKAPPKRSCEFCKLTNHTLHDCHKFTAKPMAERHEYIKATYRCFACLGFKHFSKDCKNRSTCKKCQGKHPTCLHEDRRLGAFETRSKEEFKTQASEGPPKSKWSNSGPKDAVCHRVLQEESGTKSMILPVWVSTVQNPSHEVLVYALLDTQSDTSFVLKNTSEDLHADGEPTSLRLSTMTAQDRVIQCSKFSNLAVRGYKSSRIIALPLTYSREYIPADERHIPTKEFALKWSHLRDVAEHIPPLLGCEVGLLIGCNCTRALAPLDSIIGQENEPFAVETELGWSVVGGTDPQEDSGDAIGLTHRTVTKTLPSAVQVDGEQSAVKYVCRTSVREEVLKPIEVRNILESDFKETAKGEAMSQDDVKFLEIIERSIHQDKDGHYTTSLPFREGRPTLPNNRPVAFRRLTSLKQRFIRDQAYFRDYKTFMEDILEKGDAERVKETEIVKTEEGDVWYIPHHGVYHPRKPGKIRVVFDCSSKYKGLALNNYLLQGPDMINSLIGVLCRFRKEPVAFMCDVERMFHQFRVNEEDRDYLRFIWWKDSDILKEPVDYRLKVQLFGAVSSPGIANYGLKKIAADHPEYGQEAVDFINKGFYVDDGLKSMDTVKHTIELLHNARRLCSEGKLRLHKIASNSREVLESVPESERAKDLKELNLAFESLPIERALGVEWCIESDSFQFRIILKDHPLTRRGVLSTVASVYDPLGFIAPFILLGKRILQQMCVEKADWDEPLPEELLPQWERWRQDLPKLAEIHVPRCFKPETLSELKEVQLHSFSDASMTGYGQATYLRLKDDKGQVHCSLVMGKARVAPLKPTTIPRLELQASVVSVQVGTKLENELEYDSLEQFYWTDSQIVLGYIKNEGKRFHIYVANRVQRIRNASEPHQWRHVETSENPADHASRGLRAAEFAESNWFTGPSFLWQDKLPTKDTGTFPLSSDDPEIKKGPVKVLLTRKTETRPVIERLERFSNWTSVVKAVTVIRKCILRKKGNAGANQSELTAWKESEQIIIRMIQERAFEEEISSLKRSEKVVNQGLRKLDPFLDKNGVMRVGGRLSQSSLPYDLKHPVILPKKSHLGNVLIRHFHNKVAHQGRGITVNEIRSNGYWIIGCSTAVSSVIDKCVICKKMRGGTRGQKMADLPSDRVSEAPPFSFCGIDCFGPYYIKEGRKELKRYGLLFTCLALRAVHIEVLDDMSTDVFINGLRSFIAIRGHVQRIRCDQGSNFVGAKLELQQAVKELDEERIRRTLLLKGCEFEMNPPASSHMGGVWERQIRTIRSVLSGILEQSSRQLDTSSLRTFMYETMAVINSRPLTVDNLNDPQSLLPLTPNQLLTMKSTPIMSPPGDFPREDLYSRKRWRRVQHLVDQFWIRWKKEYLVNLQTRQKWLDRTPNLEVGDIVILKEEDKARCLWRLARVEEVTPGQDGLVRKTRIVVGDSHLDKMGKRLTKPTVLERPIHKLVLLLKADA